MGPPCPPWVHRVRHGSALSPPWRVRFGRASKPCLPCVRHVSALCPPCVRPCVHFGGCASKPCRPCAHLAFVHHVSAKALALPLDFAHSWPAVGQGRGTIRQNSFAPLRNPRCLYCMPAGRFPSYLHFGWPDSACASAPYAWKTVWGLCWYNFLACNYKISRHCECVVGFLQFSSFLKCLALFLGAYWEDLPELRDAILGALLKLGAHDVAFRRGLQPLQKLNWGVCW